jgi:hypothetical protein
LGSAIEEAKAVEQKEIDVGKLLDQGSIIRKNYDHAEDLQRKEDTGTTSIRKSI